tara:strand:- start:984 stop:1901 length:918 start_codon:yes stop_codon:yes gene_type:complete
MRLALRPGARLVASTHLGDDVLRGTQHLLTEAGRSTLATHFGSGFAAGARGVVSKLNTSVSHLSAAKLWDDASRSNDITYYEVGKGTFEGGYSRQPQAEALTKLALKDLNKHCIPRSGVSPGEKIEFASLLTRLAVSVVKQGREQASQAAPEEEPLIGASAFFLSSDPDCLGRQLAAAASESPDFFAIEGCATAADVLEVAKVLDAHKKTMKVKTTTNWKGFEVEDKSPTEVGFDIPAVVMAAVPPCHEDFDDIVRAVADVPQMVCLVAPTAVADADRDRLLSMLGGKALAGASEAAGEIAILGV